jgi:acetyltransferase-like isoleucine patch superfamily enzyme
MIKKLFWKSLLWLLELPLKVRKAIKKLLIFHSFRKIGDNFLFDPLHSVFPSDGKTQIGNNVFIGENAYWRGEICVGNNVMFGPNVTLLAAKHIFAVRGKSTRFIKPYPGQNSEPIVIEDETWIAANVIITGNVTVGIGAVVGAGSVVPSNVCPFTISVGNPCRPARQIFDDANLIIHLKELGYGNKFSAEVVERRKMFLENMNIPFIDKTDIYKSIIYDAF